MIDLRIYTLMATGLLLSSCDALNENEQYVAQCESNEETVKLLKDSPQQIN